MWRYLKKKGGLDTKVYDAPLEEDLRKGLRFPSDGRLEDHLRSSGASVEDFLVAFFEAAEPYAQMMSDLLRMFEHAGATESGNNLLVRFDFGGRLGQLNFSLEHFRQWHTVWTRVAGQVQVNLWGSQSLWALHSVLQRHKQASAIHPELERWWIEYAEEKIWPTQEPSIPHTGEPAVDRRLQHVWRLWRTVVRESSRYGPKRDDLRSFQEDDSSGQSLGHDTGWSRELLANIDSDGWVGTVLVATYSIAARLQGLPQSELIGVSEELQGDLGQLLDALPQREETGEMLAHGLEEFLQLPIWERRHELYSIWVGSQIIEACEQWGPRIHHVDGLLTISFGGTHLATLSRSEPAMHLWAELRSPVENPRGLGRKKAMQPNYSMVREPVTSPQQTSVLEVECKQYRKSSPKKFADALTDYAKGRPNAQVVLVNYGPADASIRERVPAHDTHRVDIVGQLRPGSRDTKRRFGEIVRRAISTWQFRANVATATLTWDELPRDLDLHLFIELPGRTWHVYHGDLGNSNGPPWACLDVDVRTGHGAEKIEILQWVPSAKYHFAVHNYSEDAALEGCGASVDLRHGQRRWRLHCPETGIGNWWFISRTVADSDEVELVNAICPTEPTG